MTIISFNTTEELFDHLTSAQQRTQEAFQKAELWQKELKPGNFFLRAIEGLMIYCQVIPLTELSEDDRESVQEGLANGYLFCKCYSVIVPNGEYGDVHCTTAEFPLTEHQFTQARVLEWPCVGMKLGLIMGSTEGCA